ncbi:putative metal-dependent hydrolase [Chitinophagaceae bacterium LB-8]|uniref:Metal-dependent hydrolase n=1 Tax=Paraflavisolibacter caeni TaxID=2982496 RepID=A0A9X2XYY1_9BACT|nr:putative metal-dependent hydrolase [Paraflavisolibacter caeni]MCU7552139.1 putative metal-dependent hydrolase [Paraflavisolibacter caeni]
MSDIQYPIGQYVTQEYNEEKKEEWLADIKFLPQMLENAISNLDEHQLQTPYRPGGWTLHQVVHHVADSHLNAYCRFKLGYTEHNPTIKPYEEKLWASTSDVQNLPVNISITLLYSLHHRLHEFLKHFSESDWQKTIVHPEHQQQMTLWFLLGMYSWHGRHHVGHIISLRERMNW